MLAFTSNYRQAGLSRYIYELLLRVPAAIPQTRFLAFTGNRPPSADFASSLPPNLLLVPSRFPTALAPVRIAWEQAVLPLAAERARLDLLHCPVNVRPLVSPCPVVITIHDLIFLSYPQHFRPSKRFYLKVMTRWSARNAAHIIAVSEATRQDIIRLLGVRPSRVTTVYNGVGAHLTPASPEEKSLFSAQKGLSGRIVLYVGTLEPRKNLVMLLEAFHRLISAPNFEDATLLIAGSKGWYYEQIFAAAGRLGLLAAKRVRFLGRVPDDELRLWYNIAAVCAYPSRYEGFGLPVLEAMACGTPALASNTSALPEVAGDAGILLDPDDTAGWADALRRTLSDRQLAERMRRKGLAQAAKFSWERTAKETAAVYRDVLERRTAHKA